MGWRLVKAARRKTDAGRRGKQGMKENSGE